MNESGADGPYDAERWLRHNGQPPIVADVPQDVPVTGEQQKLKREVAGWWLVVWVCVIVAAAAVVILLIRR